MCVCVSEGVCVRVCMCVCVCRCVLTYYLSHFYSTAPERLRRSSSEVYVERGMYYICPIKVQHVQYTMCNMCTSCIVQHV